MIEQGLFKVLDLYSNNINLFYNNIDKYFKEQLINLTEEPALKISKAHKSFEEIIGNTISYLSSLGFKQETLENNIINPLLKDLNHNRYETFNLNLINKKLRKLIRKLFLEQIFNYLVDNNSVKILSNLNSNGFLPIEFIVELRNLKKSFEESFHSRENLKNYLQISEKIIQKLRINRCSIESLDSIEDSLDRLQFSYLIYKIIDFFNLQNLFDFTVIKKYIEHNVKDWLDTIPLVSLKNPELYYCGIYLAKKLSIEFDEDIIKYFLLDIYDENIDEFESPIFEATNKVYYFLKASSLVNLGLSELQIKELLKDKPRFFESSYLKNLDTSSLGNILRIYRFLGLFDKIDARKINPIIYEIDKRITENGIKQYRDGFISSEATYYFLISYHMRNNLKSLKNYNFLNNIVSRIFRNLEICDLSKETNLDLISEIYYSCKSLKLLNSIETDQMINLFAKYLFPDEILKRVHKTSTNVHL